MADNRREEFGRRGVTPPPVLTHAPNGLSGGPSGPSGRRKRSLTIALVSIGSFSLGAFALMEAIDRRVKCPSDQGDQKDCAESDSRSSSTSHGGSGGSSSRGSSSGELSGGHSVSFGGFGGTGGAHGGGGE